MTTDRFKRARHHVAVAGNRAPSSIWRETMAFERPPSAIGLTFRIKMQHNACDFTPVSTFRVGVEQTEIGDNVLLVVDGQNGIGGRGVGDVGIERRLPHRRSRNRVLIDQLCFGLLA